MKLSNPQKLLISLTAPQLAGGLGAIFTAPAIPTWYQTLAKPSFNPPSWLFGPVWTTLYLLMGIAVYLVWKQGKKSQPVVRLFFIHLIFNSLWSILFFGLKRVDLALIEIVFLWFLIAYLIRGFTRFSKPAAWLLVPYLAWVSFASILNFALWQLN